MESPMFCIIVATFVSVFLSITTAQLQDDGELSETKNVNSTFIMNITVNNNDETPGYVQPTEQNSTTLDELSSTATVVSNSFTLVNNSEVGGQEGKYVNNLFSDSGVSFVDNSTQMLITRNIATPEPTLFLNSTDDKAPNDSVTAGPPNDETEMQNMYFDNKMSADEIALLLMGNETETSSSNQTTASESTINDTFENRKQDFFFDATSQTNVTENGNQTDDKDFNNQTALNNVSIITSDVNETIPDATYQASLFSTFDMNGTDIPVNATNDAERVASDVGDDAFWTETNSSNKESVNKTGAVELLKNSTDMDFKNETTLLLEYPFSKSESSDILNGNFSESQSIISYPMNESEKMGDNDTLKNNSSPRINELFKLPEMDSNNETMPSVEKVFIYSNESVTEPTIFVNESWPNNINTSEVSNLERENTTIFDTSDINQTYSMVTDINPSMETVSSTENQSLLITDSVAIQPTIKLNETQSFISNPVVTESTIELNVNQSFTLTDSVVNEPAIKLNENLSETLAETPYVSEDNTSFVMETVTDNISQVVQSSFTETVKEEEKQMFNLTNSVVTEPSIFINESISKSLGTEQIPDIVNNSSVNENSVASIGFLGSISSSNISLIANDNKSQSVASTDDESNKVETSQNYTDNNTFETSDIYIQNKTFEASEISIENNTIETAGVYVANNTAEGLGVYRENSTLGDVVYPPSLMIENQVNSSETTLSSVNAVPNLANFTEEVGNLLQKESLSLNTSETDNSIDLVRDPVSEIIIAPLPSSSSDQLFSASVSTQTATTTTTPPSTTTSTSSSPTTMVDNEMEIVDGQRECPVFDTRYEGSVLYMTYQSGECEMMVTSAVAKVQFPKVARLFGKKIKERVRRIQRPVVKYQASATGRLDRSLRCQIYPIRGVGPFAFIDTIPGKCQILLSVRRTPMGALKQEENNRKKLLGFQWLPMFEFLNEALF